MAAAIGTFDPQKLAVAGQGPGNAREHIYAALGRQTWDLKAKYKNGKAYGSSGNRHSDNQGKHAQAKVQAKGKVIQEPKIMQMNGLTGRCVMIDPPK